MMDGSIRHELAPRGFIFRWCLAHVRSLRLRRALFSLYPIAHELRAGLDDGFVFVHRTIARRPCPVVRHAVVRAVSTCHVASFFVKATIMFAYPTRRLCALLRQDALDKLLGAHALGAFCPLARHARHLPFARNLGTSLAVREPPRWTLARGFVLPYPVTARNASPHRPVSNLIRLGAHYRRVDRTMKQVFA